MKSEAKRVAKVSPIKRSHIAERVHSNSKACREVSPGEGDVLHQAPAAGDRMIIDRLLRMLAAGLADHIVEVIRDASIGKIQLKPHQLPVIEMILDRIEGKSKHAYTADTNQVDEHTARLLADLLGRRLAAEEKGR